MQVAKAERLLDAPVPDVTLMGVAFRVLQADMLLTYIDEIGKPGIYISTQYKLFGFC